MAKKDGPCKDCFHWEKTDKLANKGECHRYPPKPLESGGFLWPITDDLDWCGEYDPKVLTLGDGSIRISR